MLHQVWPTATIHSRGKSAMHFFVLLEPVQSYDLLRLLTCIKKVQVKFSYFYPFIIFSVLYRQT